MSAARLTAAATNRATGRPSRAVATVAVWATKTRARSATPRGERTDRTADVNRRFTVGSLPGGSHEGSCGGPVRRERRRTAPRRGPVGYPAGTAGGRRAGTPQGHGPAAGPRGGRPARWRPARSTALPGCSGNAGGPLAAQAGGVDERVGPVEGDPVRDD